MSDLEEAVSHSLQGGLPRGGGLGDALKDGKNFEESREGLGYRERILEASMSVG